MTKTLTGRVIEVHDGSEYTDKLRRVVITVDNADSMYRRVRITDDTLRLGDEVELVLELTSKAAQV